MSRGRKPVSYKAVSNWEDIFWNSLPTYIGIINNYFKNTGCEMVEIGANLEKLSFTIPKGLNSKEIKIIGTFPVISQSKEYIIGYSDREDLLVKDDLPLIIFGDHSKTVKFVDKPFIIGADGVKIIKPKKIFDERFFYYSLYGIITDTKDYGRHFGLLRKGVLPEIKNFKLQNSIVEFLDNLKTNSLSINKEYFNKKTEDDILSLQATQINTNSISSELAHQLTLIKKLRKQLLQDAVQGKLVKQNPKDEPASELLKKIKAEKEKLIAEKKINKEKELPPIKPDEIPFEIPKNWVWCRLGELLNIKSGKRIHASDYRLNGIPFLRSGEIGSLGRGENLKTELFISEIKYQEIKNNFGIPKPGDILIACIGGSIGNTWMVDEREFYFKDGNLVLIESIQELIVNYILSYLKSPFFWKDTIMNATDSSYNALTIIKLNVAKFPLPPVAEQIRIVQKLNELMQYCDALEESIKESAAQNEKLMQQVLREALSKQEIKIKS